MKRGYSEAQIRGIGMTSQRTRDRLVDRLREKGINDARVLDAMRTVPRHLFVDEAIATRAYEDTALPIGHGQTISQPYVVARMTEALLNGSDVEQVLEIGSGSGYQAAVLSRLVKRVVSVERNGTLADQARERLRSLDYRNVEIIHADGEWGWAKGAPYDAIMVTAAPDRVPQKLLHQLSDGGTLVIPVGGRGDVQRLLRIVRHGDDTTQDELDLVSFVPFLQGCV